MSDIIAAILGADFQKVTGFFGMLCLILGIVPGQIKLFSINLPGRDKIGRIVSIFLGFVFVMVPIGSSYLTTTIGGVGIATENSVTRIDETAPQGSLDLFSIGSAYAQTNGYNITILQRSTVDTTNVFDGFKSTLYVGDIHLGRPNVVVIFRSDAPGAAKVTSGARLDEREIGNILRPQDIYFLASLRQGDQRSIQVAGGTYTLKVVTVLWNIVGKDSMDLTVLPNR